MKKLLLVDDFLGLPKSYADYLKLFYSINDIRIAQNGKEALEKILEDKPDVLVTDLDMPVMNGYELCKEVRKNQETNNIYIILHSGDKLPKEIKNYVNEIIPKGKTEEILKRLSELLGGKKNE